MERVFVITNPMPLHNNSPAVSLGKFIQVICAAGYSPSVIGARIPENGIPGVPENVPVRSFGYGGKGILKMLSFVLLQARLFFSCLLKFRKNDAVYFWIADKMIGAYLAAKLRGAEINYFLYGRNPHIPVWSQSLINYMVCHADFVCAEAFSVFGECNVPADKLLNVIQLFVPETNITLMPYRKRGTIVAIMSRLCTEKHPFETIGAVCRVHEIIPELRLHVIGGGPLENECRELVKEYGAEDFIRFFGWLPSDEAKCELSRCRLLMYPSDVEGVPGGILEAMSMGIPALASPVGGIPDLIEDGVDGVLLPGTDVDTIAAELTALLDSDKLQAISDAAMKKIQEKYSLKAAAENFRAVRESHR